MVVLQEMFLFLWLNILTGFLAAIANTKLQTFYHIFRRKEEKQGK